MNKTQTPSARCSMHRLMTLAAALIAALTAPIAGTMAAARAGTPMPNNSEMTRFWKEMEVSRPNITQGRELTKDGLDKAAQRIRSR
jgi:maltose-binding protein MalE